jgi:hypothetical protein
MIDKTFEELSEEFDEDVQIDVNDLGKELYTQPSLYIKWAKIWANESHRRDFFKARLEQVKAEVELDIRDNPKEWGIEKVTEASVRALVECDEGVEKARNAFFQASRNLNNALSAKLAMEQRKSMLENIVKVYQTGYWGELPVPDKQDRASHYEERERVSKKKPNPRVKGRRRNG